MYNLDVEETDTFYVGKAQWLVHNQESSRSAAFRQIKRDLGIPMGTHPIKVDKSTLLRDANKNPVLDSSGKPVPVREYYFKTTAGKTVVIQEHGLGHQYPRGVGNQGPHFNARPENNLKTGSLPGTLEHYYFKLCE
jgi:hypothetical protein